MLRFARFAVLSLAIAAVSPQLTACVISADTLSKVKGLADSATGGIEGTVLDPDGKGMANATVKVYKNLDIGKLTMPRKDAEGTNKLVVDFEKLADGVPLMEAKTDASGHYAFPALKALDAPFILVAENSKGKDFAGINRDTREFFSIGQSAATGDVKIDVSNVITVKPGLKTTVDFHLPSETPPTPPAPEPEPTIAAPPPPADDAPKAPETPTKPADVVQADSKLPTEADTATVAFGALTAERVDGTTTMALTVADTGEGGLVLYDMNDIGSSAVSNKIRLKLKLDTGTLQTAVLRISHLPKGEKKATITTQDVSFEKGMLVSDDAAGYLFAVPRDGGTTVLQVTDPTSGALSNPIAIDTSKIKAEDVRPFTVILSWDKGDGTDIDLHVFDLDKKEESWFGNLGISNGALDLDNTEGFGPETYTGKAGHYGISINYWSGIVTTNVKVRVITATSDETYTHPLKSMGQWWDVIEVK